MRCRELRQNLTLEMKSTLGFYYSLINRYCFKGLSNLFKSLGSVAKHSLNVTFDVLDLLLEVVHHSFGARTVLL